jgi:hypothetical protein
MLVRLLEHRGRITSRRQVARRAPSPHLQDDRGLDKAPVPAWVSMLTQLPSRGTELSPSFGNICGISRRPALEEGSCLAMRAICRACIPRFAIDQRFVCFFR